MRNMDSNANDHIIALATILQMGSWTSDSESRDNLAFPSVNPTSTVLEAPTGRRVEHSETKDAMLATLYRPWGLLDRRSDGTGCDRSNVLGSDV